MAFFAAGYGFRPAIKWQWHDHGQRWVDYDPTSNGMVESCFTAGRPSAAVHSASGGRAGTGAAYVIDFANMTQVNNATQFTRAVRRNAVVHGTPSHEQWEWKRSSGSTWEPVPVHICLQIMVSRNSRQESYTVAFIDDEAHEFDFTGMTVTNIIAGDMLPLRLSATGQTVGAGAGAGAGGSSSASNAFPASVSTGSRSRSRASAAPPQSDGDRKAEYQRVIDEATDSTAIAEGNDTCAVCLEGFSADEPALLLSRCQGHYMHAECIMEAFLAMGPKCPTCSMMYGVIRGNQPDGTMTVRTYRRGTMPLSGYESEATILIQYNFPPGIQGPQHPNEGATYHGTSRSAYLPDNAAGREVLALLKRAFDQRMIFTVGTSLTTGISNSIVWNGIHHKTSCSGGCASFGYPDPGYFARVKMELAAKGIK